jgi:hypothetical protein
LPAATLARLPPPVEVSQRLDSETQLFGGLPQKTAVYLALSQILCRIFASFRKKHQKKRQFSVVCDAHHNIPMGIWQYTPCSAK